MNAGIVGLTLTYVLPIVERLNSMLNDFVETEKQMIAVERVDEYSRLTQEDTRIDATMMINTKTNKDLCVMDSSSWPSAGRVDMHLVRVLYPNETQAALDRVTCVIHAGEKIGICGRTGAGKSSLIRCLFRMVSYSGTIKIDGVDLLTLPCDVLRQRMCAIPQQPVLFSGTVRSNLDPNGHLTDQALLTALRQCGLYDTFFPELLDTLVDGSNVWLSHGQRQLLCLARALVRKSKLVCIDEATACMDVQTEALMQQTMAEAFVDATVLTIAHRTHTIMQSTRVMVLDQGRIVEFDHPSNLIENQNSQFAALFAETQR